MSEVTRILSAIQSGERRAADDLLPVVYTELRQLATHRMTLERPGQTLQATALVHEAWLRLVREQDRQWNDSHHFFCAAAQAMRRILVENARRKQALKHGGQLNRVNGELDIAAPLPDDQLLALDEALDQLAAVNSRAADVVKLRFFAGLTEAQVAGELGVSVATVERTWAFARAWLFNEIQQDLKNSSDVRENTSENRV